jgi:glycosyltransferase involved in cell wall biosynthesis
MNIVHISTSASGGGAGIAAYRLYRGLKKHKEITATLIQQAPTSDEQFAQGISTVYPKVSLRYRIEKNLKMLPGYRNTRKIANLPVNYDFISFPTTSYRLEELPVVKNADIVHLHWVANFINYPTFFRNIKQPIVWTLHDINPFMGIFHFETDRLKNIDTLGKLDRSVLECKIRSIHKKDNIHVVCLSEWLKNQSEHSVALGRYPHYLIPNGLDFSKYPVLNRDEAKAKIGVDNSLKTFLVVGAFLDSQNKGFPLFFDAINKINRTDFNLLTVGRHPEGIKIDSKVNHTHFGSISDAGKLNDIYAAADITIIPSKEDNLPNVMLESFANGTPIMSFGNGGMAEHMQGGQNGILIDRVDENALISKINLFLDNQYNFDARHIRNYAESTFSEDLQVDKYIQLYKDILKPV